MPKNHNNLPPDNVHSVIIDMLEEITEEYRNNKVNKNKISVLMSLIFEHIFHRTHTFISDELDEFRDLPDKVENHTKVIKWGEPILKDAEKIIKRIKQIGVIISILITLGTIGYQVYSIISHITGKHIHTEIINNDDENKITHKE